MFKNQLFILLATAVMLVMACQGNDKETESKLYEDVMTVHNECMPKMAELNRVKRHLKEYKDIVPDESSSLKDSLINTILVLSKSEDNMNDWMEKFNYPNPNISHEEMLKYLTGQKDSIKKISDDIFMSLAIGKSFLNNAPDSLKSRLDIKTDK
jgi:hypothetical protein